MKLSIMKGKYDKVNVVNKASRLDYVIIDEIGQAQAYLYEILIYIKRKSKVKFILLGDFNDDE